MVLHFLLGTGSDSHFFPFRWRLFLYMYACLYLMLTTRSRLLFNLLYCPLLRLFRLLYIPRIFSSKHLSWWVHGFNKFQGTLYMTTNSPVRWTLLKEREHLVSYMYNYVIPILQCTCILCMCMYTYTTALCTCTCMYNVVYMYNVHVLYVHV